MATVLLAAGLSGLVTQAAPSAVAVPVVPAVPVVAGTPAAPIQVFLEDFENGQSNTVHTMIRDYTGAQFAQKYTTANIWNDLSQCNGVILSSLVPRPLTPVAGCTETGWGAIQRLALGLGTVAGDPTPEDNHAVSAWTSTVATGVNSLILQTVTGIPVTAGHFYGTSIDSVGVSCGNDPKLRFYLMPDNDPGSATQVNSTVIDPCLVPPSAVLAPQPPPAMNPPGGQVRGYHVASDGSFLVAPGTTTLGIQLKDESGVTSGNDGAFDNIRLLDVTPQLDVAFAPNPVRRDTPTKLTLTITNTSELGAKTGWSFAQALPAGVVVAPTPNLSSDCTGGTNTAVAGATGVTIGGSLDAGETFCTVTVDVVAAASGTYDTTVADTTALAGVLPPPPASLLVRGPDIAVLVSGPDRVDIGAPINWSILVSNLGPVDASSVTVTDTVPDYIDDVTLVPIQGCSLNGRVLTCTFPIPSGGSKTIELSGTTTSTTPTPASNGASATAGDDDPDPGNNASTHSTRIGRGQPDRAVQPKRDGDDRSCNGGGRDPKNGGSGNNRNGGC